MGTKRMVFQNQAEVNAHPSQIALGANAAAGDIRYVDVNGDGVLEMTELTWESNTESDYGIQFTIEL
jgi:hypothetical protein